MSIELDNRFSTRDLSASAFYDELTQELLKAVGEHRTVHFKLWGPNTNSEQDGIKRTLDTLVEGCGLKPGMHVLDSGCGLGGPAVALAQNYGVCVTGLTNCKSHVALNTQWAEQQGVSELVDFHYGDFMKMPFADETFDVVVNQESFCYASDRLAYLRGVRRVLKPLGKWRLLDALRTPKPMSESQQSLSLNMQRSWHIPPLASMFELVTTLDKAGFENIWERDLSDEVLAFCDDFLRRWRFLVFASPPPKPHQVPFRELMQGCIELDKGIQEGIFSYSLVSGTSPNNPRRK